MSIQQLKPQAGKTTTYIITQDGIEEQSVQSARVQKKNPTIRYDGKTLSYFSEEGLQMTRKTAVRAFNMESMFMGSERITAASIMARVTNSIQHHPDRPSQRPIPKPGFTVCCLCKKGECDVKYCKCFKNARYCMKECLSHHCKNKILPTKTLSNVNFSMTVGDFQLLCPFNPITNYHPNDPQQRKRAKDEKMEKQAKLTRLLDRQKILQVLRRPCGDVEECILQRESHIKQIQFVVDSMEEDKSFSFQNNPVENPLPHDEDQKEDPIYDNTFFTDWMENGRIEHDRYEVDLLMGDSFADVKIPDIETFD